MKKLPLTTSIALVLMGATQVVYAVTPKPPTLKTPANFDNLAKNNLLFFEWLAPNNAVDAGVKEYRLIITTSTDGKFSDYDKNKKKCLKASCFTTLTKTTKLALSAAFKAYLKSGKTYLWQVQALSKSDISKFSGNTFRFTLNEIPLKILDVNVTPESATIGSEFTFSSTLTTDLPNGYSVQIDYGDGLKKMAPSGITAVNFVYAATPNNIGLNPFEISLFDKDNVKIQDSQYAGSYEVLEIPFVEPTINNVSVSPTSIKEGQSLTFSASLSNAIPTGYSVKIDYGNGLKTMMQSDKTAVNFTYTATPNTTGITQFKIALYNKDGVEIDEEIGSYEVVKKLPIISKISVLPTSITLGDSLTFSATLNTALPSGYNVKVDYGIGLFKMNGTNTSFSLVAKPLISSTYSIGLYDAKDLLIGDKQTGNFSVNLPTTTNVEKPPVTNPPVTATDATYTKIANNGTELSATSKLGTQSTDWACTRDNRTGLIWEVKVDDNSLRDKDWYYSWYEPDASKNGGFEGYPNYYSKGCKGSECDTYAYTNAVNQQSLCGANDWRMPTRSELMTLVLCSNGQYDTNDGQCVNYNAVTRPTINKTFFPNTKNVSFWSSTFHVSYPDYAWFVDFNDGYDSNGNAIESKGYSVRLVRDGSVLLGN